MRSNTLTLALSAALALPGAQTSGRESITFILGDTKDGMYALAKSFHESQDDRVVTSIHSLQGVRDYLEQHPPADDQPWGRVELVMHGNGRGQTDVPLWEAGTITTTAYLSQVLEGGDFHPLPDRLLDGQSEIRLHGCALGQDEAFLGLISRALGGMDEQRPTVSASRLYTCYQRSGEGIQRYYSEAWSLVFPPEREPSAQEITMRLRQQEPTCDLEAEDTLSRQAARFPGDSYVETKSLQFQWKVVFERQEERPVAGSAVAWLRRQKDLLERLKEQGLSFEDLSWSTQAARESFHGRMYPTLQVLGKGKAFHILRTQKETDLPWDDPRYCASAK